MGKPFKNQLSERQVERLLMSGLQTLGYLPVKTDAGAKSRFSRELSGRPIRGDMPKGFPDLVVCHPERPPFFVEVKREGGKLSAYQERYHAYLRSMGYDVYVVVGEAEVEAFLKSLPEWEKVRGVL